MPLQVGYLEDMSADLRNLEKCAAVLQQHRHGPRPSQYNSAVRTGNALASKCCSWCMIHSQHLHTPAKTRMTGPDIIPHVQHFQRGGEALQC